MSKPEYAGPSIIETLWTELMTITERLLTGQEAEDGRDQGRAEGVAYALAVMHNPYQPSLPEIRREVMRRWHEESEAD